MKLTMMFLSTFLIGWSMVIFTYLFDLNILVSGVGLMAMPLSLLGMGFTYKDTDEVNDE